MSEPSREAGREARAPEEELDRAPDLRGVAGEGSQGAQEASIAKAEKDIDLSLDALLALEGMEGASDPVRMYLKEIGHVPLLSSSDEKWHSMKMMAPRYLDKIRRQVGGAVGADAEGRFLLRLHNPAEAYRRIQAGPGG